MLIGILLQYRFCRDNDARQGRPTPQLASKQIRNCNLLIILFGYQDENVRGGNAYIVVHNHVIEKYPNKIIQK